MLFEIEQQFLPICAVILVKQTPARAFDAEPDAIAIQHAPQAGERQAVIAKRLAVTRSDHVDRVRSVGNDLLRAFGRLGFRNRRKTRQTLSPKMLSFDWTNGFEVLPRFINLEQLDPLSQVGAQKHVSLSRSLQRLVADDHQEFFDEWHFRTLAHASEPEQRG